MPAAVASHSHRPTTKVSHKPFKTRAASKHELRDRAKGKIFAISFGLFFFLVTYILTKPQVEYPTKRANEKHPTSKSCLNSTDATRPNRLG